MSFNICDNFEPADYTKAELEKLKDAIESELEHRAKPITIGQLRSETSSRFGAVVSDTAELFVGDPDEPTESPCPVLGHKYRGRRLYLIIGEG